MLCVSDFSQVKTVQEEFFIFIFVCLRNSSVF